MNGISIFANKSLSKPILDMGAPINMLIVLTLLALLFGVKFSALEGAVAKSCYRPYWYRCHHRYVEWSQRSAKLLRILAEAAHENEPRLAVPSCHDG